MKFIYLLGALALTTLAACNTQPETTTQTDVIETTKATETETVKEVAVEKPAKVVTVQAPAEKPAPQPEPVKEKDTSIKIGRDGASVKTKKIDIDFSN